MATATKAAGAAAAAALSAAPAADLAKTALPAGPKNFQVLKLYRALAWKAAQVDGTGARAAARQHCTIALAAFGVQLGL